MRNVVRDAERRDLTTDRRGRGRDPRTQMVAAARDWAEVAAMLGDHAEAIAWLDVVESLLGQLPPSLIARRRQLAGR